MRKYADLLETVAPADDSAEERNLTTLAKVKTALNITGTDSDALITDLLPKVSKDIENYCRLERSAGGEVPTFALETLRATWFAPDWQERFRPRGAEIYLPWRPPIASIDSVTEDGNTLVAGTDYRVLGNGKSARLQRFNGTSPLYWSANEIVVQFKAGFESVMSDNIEAELAAAAIEQLKGLLFSVDRDPAIRSENVPDMAAVTYSVPGGDVMGASALLPAVRDRLASWKNPAL